MSQRKVLLLNKGWKALKLVSLEKAYKLLCSFNRGTKTPKAIVIDHQDYAQYTWDDWIKLKPHENEDTIVTAKGVLRVPLVIALTKYDKRTFLGVGFSRKRLWERDDNQCQYCGCRNGEMTVDHIIPKCQGGQSTWENCCLACVKCNMKKAGRTPQQAGMKFFNPNFKPARPKTNFFKKDIIKCRTWQELIDTAYWNVELQD